MILAAAVSLLSVLPAAAKSAAPASLDPKDAMRFALVRQGEMSCEPTCAEWISAEGTIMPETAGKFRRFLKTVGDRKLPVVIQSPGGAVESALAMARLIRARGLDVAVGRTSFFGCAPGRSDCKPGEGGVYAGSATGLYAYCASACPMVVAGGVNRYVGSMAFLGVHQITTIYQQQRITYRDTTRIVKGRKVTTRTVIGRKNSGTFTKTEMSKAQRRQLEAFFSEMGVGRDILQPITATPASSILKIEQKDLLAYKLITGTQPADGLISIYACRQLPLPVNCRRVVPIPIPTPAPREEMRQEMLEASLVPAAVPPVEAPREEADGGEMRFVLARAGAPACGEVCPQWIAAEGVVTQATARNLRAFLFSIGGRRLPILFNSSDGDVGAAMEMGAIIREHGMDVAVAHTEFAPCAAAGGDCSDPAVAHVGRAVEAGSECRSACPLLLAAGVRRLAGPRAHIFLKGLGFNEQVRAYLDRMVIAPAMFWMMSGEPTYISIEVDQPTAMRTALTTGPLSVEQFISPALCAMRERPENCRAVDHDL